MATERTRPRQPPSTPPDEYEHLGFILAEEDALKRFLEQTVTLPDGKGSETPVRVWYRYPATEHTITYPFVTLDLIGIEPAYDLWTSFYYISPNDESSDVSHDSITGETIDRRLYDPDTSPLIEPSQYPGKRLQRMHYRQFRLYYQIGLWSVNAYHDRLLSARMIRDIVLPRPFWLLVSADQVWRRLEVLEWVAADTVGQEGASKRIFRKMMTVSIQTDIPQDRLNSPEFLDGLRPDIQKVLIRLKDTEGGEWLDPEQPPPTTTDPTDGWRTYATRTPS